MGECFSREKLTEPEVLLTNREHDLKYNTNKSERIDLVLRKYSHIEHLNEEQLKDAARVLGLQIENTATNTKIKEFYSHLKTENKYALHRLLITGILLGTGSNETKARLLFEVYDNDGNHRITEVVVAILVREIYEVAVNALPTVADLTQSAVSTYLHNIKLRRTDSENELKAKILGTEHEITLDKFLAAFAKEDLAHFLTSHGARAFFYKVYESKKSLFYLKDAAGKLQQPKQATITKTVEETTVDGAKTTTTTTTTTTSADVALPPVLVAPLTSTIASAPPHSAPPQTTPPPQASAATTAPSEPKK